MRVPKFRPIPEWRSAWRFACVWASIALGLLSAVQADVLPLIQPIVPQQYWPYLTGAIALLIVLLRLVDQRIPPAPARPEGNS